MGNGELIKNQSFTLWSKIKHAVNGFFMLIIKITYHFCYPSNLDNHRRYNAIFVSFFFHLKLKKIVRQCFNCACVENTALLSRLSQYIKLQIKCTGIFLVISIDQMALFTLHRNGCKWFAIETSSIKFLDTYKCAVMKIHAVH